MGGDIARGLHEEVFFLWGEVVGDELADAEGAAEAGAVEDGDGEGALDLGLLGTYSGDAGGVGLEVAHFDRFLALGGEAGDAFAYGDGLDDGHEGLGDALVGDEFEVAICGVEAVKGAGGAAELCDGLSEKICPGGGGGGKHDAMFEG